MQNNCNSLIPWKTFLMRKIWRFSAPSKRNLGLVVPGADVAVPGLSLSDYWAFWTLGTLAAAAAPLGEGGDRRGGRKESSDEEGWVCGVFTVRINFVRICAVPAWLQLRDPFESPARPLTPASPCARTFKHRPCVPTPKADFRSVPCGYVSASTEKE